MRIVLTGGPGGGKTTAADLLRREIGDSLVVVPEAATLLFSGGFPRLSGVAPQRSTQKAIYHVQVGLEDVHARAYPERVLICDRGTVDGAAYWPTNGYDFFEMVESDLETEMARYDAVLFFETAAVGDLRIEGGNRVRIENNKQAIELDLKLRQLWSQHPNYTLIAHTESFIEKLNVALKCMRRVLDSNTRHPA